MIKFRITRIDDVVPMDRWASLIDDTDACQKFLKAMYGFDVEEVHYGQWFVCGLDSQWTCPADKFAHYYRIIGAMKEEKQIIGSLYGKTPTCAGMYTGECKCSTSKKPIEIKDQNFPVSISVSCSKENGFFMSVDFANDNKE